MKRFAAWAAAVACAAAVAVDRPARAENGPEGSASGGASGVAETAPAASGSDAAMEERMRRLEDLIRRQAEEIDRLRREVETSGSGRAAEATGPAPTTRAVPSVSVVSRSASGSPATPLAAPSMPPPPSAPVLVDTRARTFAGGDLGGASLGGYLTVEYVAPSNRNSYVDLHRLILAVDAAITQDIDFQAEIEYEHGGISDEVDGEIKIEQAVVRFHLCDALVPKVGALLIPFGRYNLFHDDPINDFTIRPFTARKLIHTGFGQPGLGVEGAIPFGRGHLFTYDAAVTSGFEDEFSADEGTEEAIQPWNRDNNEDKQVWGRVAVNLCAPWLDHLEVGASGTWGRYDDEGRDDLFGWSVDALVRKGPFEVKGEYIAYDIERDALDAPDAITGQSGVWLEAGWHFMPCALRRCRSALFTDTSHFTLAVRWQTMDLDEGRRGTTFEDDLEAWSVGLNYRITERSVFRVDHTWYDAAGRPDVRELTVSFSTYF